MTIVCNIWMICLELNWFIYDPSWILQLSEFTWTLRSSACVVFNNFLLIDEIDKSKICSDQKRLYFAVSLHPLSFFANTPFKLWSVKEVFVKVKPLKREINCLKSRIKGYLSFFLRKCIITWNCFLKKAQYFFWGRGTSYLLVHVCTW